MKSIYPNKQKVNGEIHIIDLSLIHFDKMNTRDNYSGQTQQIEMNKNKKEEESYLGGISRAQNFCDSGSEFQCATRACGHFPLMTCLHILFEGNMVAQHSKGRKDQVANVWLKP